MATTLDLEEQEQLEALKHFWKTWGTLISIIAIVVLLALAGWNGWRIWQSRQASAASGLYGSLLEAVDVADASRVELAYTTLKDNYGSTTYASQGALLAGKTLIAMGKNDQGKAALQWAADSGATPGLQALGRLRLAAELASEKSYDQAQKLLSWSFPPMFEPLAADRRGDVYLQQGDKSSAITQYGKAYQGMGPDFGNYRRIVAYKLASLGINADAGAAQVAQSK